jgi:hypothetical protein
VELTTIPKITTAEEASAALSAYSTALTQIVVLLDVEPELTQEQRIARGAELLSRHAARLAVRVAENASRKGGARDNS